jgi:hypothetical protein
MKCPYVKPGVFFLLTYCVEYFPWQNEEELTRWMLEPAGASLEELARRPKGYPYQPVRYEKWREKPLRPAGQGGVHLAAR